MKQVVAYLRVSSQGQKDGDGFSRQIHAIKDYCKVHNYNIIHFFKDTFTGTQEERPALTDLIAQDVKTIVIERLDRLARDLMVQEIIIREFKEKGFNLISAAEGPDLCADDPSRKVIRQLMGAFAEYDKSMLVAKLRAGRDRKRKEGKVEGRKGYRDKEEGKIILQRLRQMRKKKPGYTRKTYKEIADILNSEGTTTLDGNWWTLYRVARVLKHK